MDNPVIPPRLRRVVQEYLDDGFCWFAFDVVSLENKFKTLEALQYRFASSGAVLSGEDLAREPGPDLDRTADSEPDVAGDVHAAFLAARSNCGMSR